MRIFAVLLDLYPVIYYVFEERLCEFLRTLNNYRIAERIVIENPYIINGLILAWDCLHIPA